MSERIYNEKEINRLIKRAAELEAERSVNRADGKRGLTITELEQVAAESGIDPELIHKASRELEEEHSKSSNDNKTRVKTDEIFCERWVDIRPDKNDIESILTELNHRYGTSEDDISWWDKLWDDYAGKPKIRRTPHSVEWNFTDEWEMTTLRVLLQRRGNRFRIRVSKKETFGWAWNVDGMHNWIIGPIALVLGGVAGHFLLSSVWQGVLLGLLFFAVFYPGSKYFSNRHIKRNTVEVTEIAEDIAELSLQLSEEKKFSAKTTEPQKSRTIDIEDEDRFNYSTGTKSGRLKNELR